MSLVNILKKRKSVRAFLNKNVEKEKIEKILEGIKYTPSGSNMQPWIVHVVSGETKALIDEKTFRAFDKQEMPKMDYTYYPENIPDLYQNRRRKTAFQLYDSLNIKKEDKEKRIKQWRANYNAFGAPVIIYFFMDKQLCTGSYLDMGMILQSTLLLAEEEGLATCAMASLAEYPNIVRDILNIDNSKYLIYGIALGYEDKEAKINGYRTPRLEVNDFVTFHN